MHALSGGVGVLLTGQTPKSHKMSPEWVTKPDPSVKLSPSTTPSPPVTFDKN